MEAHVQQPVNLIRPSTAAALQPTLEINVKSSLTHALLIPARMVVLVPTRVQETTHVNVVLSSQEQTVTLLLTTVHFSLPTVTMGAVRMVLEPSPVNVIQDSQETSVTRISMSVKQLNARMLNVKTYLMHSVAYVTQDGQGNYVILISTIVDWTNPTLDHVMIQEQMTALTETPHTHVCVSMATLATTAQRILMIVNPIPVKMVEPVPTSCLVTLNVTVQKAIQVTPVV